MYTIDSAERLKSPFCCYCIFLNYKKITEEDYLEKNEAIFNPYHFLCWLMKRGDIKNEQLEKAMNMERPNLQDVFQEILFPNTLGKSLLAGIKKYSLLAEYISQFLIMRQKLWDSVHDKAIYLLSCLHSSLCGRDLLEREKYENMCNWSQAKTLIWL